MRRREILRLALYVAASGIGSSARASWARRTPAPDASPLSPEDACLADLGDRFALEDPATARDLTRAVEASQPRARGRRPVAVRRLRAALLGRRSRERDLARGAVLSIDGWMLTRSEVACCVYLAAVRRDSGGGGARAKLG